MTEPVLEVNGRGYAFPVQPLVVVCIDGSAPDYHEQAVAGGRMPFVESVTRTGTSLRGDCAMPSFTNPNNVSIATGVPPAVHGISGNCILDRDRGVEVMTNDPAWLTAPTIFAAFDHAGVAVAIVTAKDKLRRLLGHGVEHGICFSAERADAARSECGIDALALTGRPVPAVYSADASEFVMAAGVRLLQHHQPALMYLTLSDYVQHQFPPGSDEANGFYEMIDGYLAELDALGAVVVVTADHGMHAKSSDEGTPRVVYLQDRLDTWLGPDHSRVVLPITDPYTRHHGALGSCAFVYLRDGDGRDLAGRIGAVSGIELVATRDEACRRFELPADRIGDLTVFAGADTVVGKSPDAHDLSQLERPLRSHGGLAEQRVPVIVNRTIRPVPDGHRLRNFDAFWLGLNLAGAGGTATEPRVTR